MWKVGVAEMRCRVLKKLPRTQWQYGRDDDSRRQLGKLTKEARKQMNIRAGHHRLGKIVICLRKWRGGAALFSRTRIFITCFKD